MQNPPEAGFTLIEMSIVLMIIGLVVGGVLVGQDLINAAGQRAQISQIEKYNTAVRTFQLKYGGYLPGDIPDPTASNFGFQARGTGLAQGDGNGIVEGACANVAFRGWDQGCGEYAAFWPDLSTANLIDTTILGANVMGAGWPSPTSGGSSATLSSTPGVKDWLPAAKLGQGNFIYVFSDTVANINYFGVSAVYQIGWSVQSNASPGITVQQAYNIDKKIDDGLPQSGRVTACYINYDVVNWALVYAAGNDLKGANNGALTNGYNGGFNYCTPTTAATVPASTDCFGNNNTAGTMTYSVGTNANLQNCALSFKFQ